MVPEARESIFWEPILHEAPRILGMMDREAISPTSGCGDRVFWAWKFVDYPGSRFQESLCVLGFLYATDRADNPYHRNPNLLRWISQGLGFWHSIQYADGSFDEAYPFERSLAATAFTSFYVSECLHFMGDDLPRETRTRTLAALARAGDWLVANDEVHGFLSNHLAAAAAALAHIARLTGDERYAARSRYFVDKILRRQSSEGWYDEYGGFDPGYQTHGSFYLARIWELTGEAELLASLDRSMHFLRHFIHPDGSLGGEYASRNTQTYYPAAFEMLAGESDVAAHIAGRMRPSVRSGAAAGIRSVDSYNYYPFLNNLVFAYRACTSPGAEAVPVSPSEVSDEEDALLWFPEAGIARIRRPAYDAYVGTRKGGVLKVFDRSSGSLVLNDCGYIGRTNRGGYVTSQFDQDNRDVSVSVDRIIVSGSFAEVSKPTMSPPKFLAFRLFNLTAARVPGLALWIKSVLVKSLIYRRRSVDLSMDREIRFLPDSVEVRDTLKGGAGGEFEELRWEPLFTTIHMGSSRYFIPNELNELPVQASSSSPEVNLAGLQAGLSIERKIQLNQS